MLLYLKYLITEKGINKWSSKVVAKWHPPENLFKDGSASEIADVLAKNSEDLGQAMSRLNFYLNRAGSNIKASRRSELNGVKDLLRAKFKSGKE